MLNRTQPIRTALLGILGTAVCTAALPASATDGTIELNQTCAIETGCGPGDAPGFPITLPGNSLRLTSNLLVTSGDIGISLSGGEYNIDLNGFAIEAGSVGISGFNANAGVRIRNGFINSFDPQDLSRGVGIDMGISTQVSVENLDIMYSTRGIRCISPCSVKNTRIVYVTEYAIQAGNHAVIQGVTARRAAGTTTAAAISVGAYSRVESSMILFGQGGISAGSYSSISDNTLTSNSISGSSDSIHCGDGCRVGDNVVTGGGADGISVGAESSVIGNTVTNSGGNGISASISALIKDNAASGNGLDGIVAANASTIRDNTTNSNGGDGIDAGNGSNVRGNSGRSNAGYGLRAESTLVGFADNIFGNNNGGSTSPQTADGLDLGGNLCDSSTSCP